MILIDYPEKSQWQELLKRPVMNTESLFGVVQGIIGRVKAEGDEAVREYERQFDKVELTTLAVSPEEFEEAEHRVSEELKAAIRLATDNIAAFHASQRFEGKKVETSGVGLLAEGGSHRESGSVYSGRNGSPVFHGTDARRACPHSRVSGDCVVYPSGA